MPISTRPRTTVACCAVGAAAPAARPASSTVSARIWRLTRAHSSPKGLSSLHMVSLLFAMTLLAQDVTEPPGRGIPEELARERKAAISALRYELTFTVPE